MHWAYTVSCSQVFRKIMNEKHPSFKEMCELWHLAHEFTYWYTVTGYPGVCVVRVCVHSPWCRTTHFFDKTELRVSPDRFILVTCLCSPLQFNFHTFPRILGWRKLSCLDRIQQATHSKLTKAAISLFYIDLLIWNMWFFLTWAFGMSCKRLATHKQELLNLIGDCKVIVWLCSLFRKVIKWNVIKMSHLECRVTTTEQWNLSLTSVWNSLTGQVSFLPAVDIY